MTKAVLRFCPRCKHGPFEKDDGCNRVKCPKCGYQHCYACGKEVQHYADHFGKNKTCILFEVTADRLKKEAAAAQKRTVREILLQQPKLKEKDVIVDETIIEGRNDDTDIDPVRTVVRDDGWGLDLERLDDNRPPDISRSFRLVVTSLHVIALLCLVGLISGMIKVLKDSEVTLPIGLILAILTMFPSLAILSMISCCGFRGDTLGMIVPGILNLFLSLSAAIVMSVQLGNGTFGIGY